MAMQSPSSVLLKKEFKKFARAPHEYVKFDSLNGDNIFEWIVYVVGPPETVYAGGVWRTLIRFPDDFPMSPPSLQFLNASRGTPFFHPNVYRDGKVCISTLQVPVPDAEDEGVNVGGYWTPVSGMETIFVSVLSLLSDPNPDSPANAEAARLYRDDKKEFAKNVQASIEWSLKVKPDHIVLRKDGRLADYEPPKAPQEDSVDFDINDDGDAGDFDSDSGDDVEGVTDDDEDNDDDEDVPYDDGSGPYSPPMEEDE